VEHLTNLDPATILGIDGATVDEQARFKEERSRASNDDDPQTVG
jgi:hypothetical protein